MPETMATNIEMEKQADAELWRRFLSRLDTGQLETVIKTLGKVHLKEMDSEQTRDTQGQEGLKNYMINMICQESSDKISSVIAALIPRPETDSRRVPLSYVDKSKANTIQTGKNKEDVLKKVEVLVKRVEDTSRERAPAGVVLDGSKVTISALGTYMEGRDFQRQKEVLGTGNCAGVIEVIKDIKTGTEHAVKKVMIPALWVDEIYAWVALGESDSFPSLYMVRLVDNTVVFHMEKIEHGVTWDDLVNEHMARLCEKKFDLVRPFVLRMLHGLLSCIKEMHDKKWSHGDLHGGNVMMTKHTTRVIVLDFGRARRLGCGDGFKHDDLKNDILNATRLFCGLYIGDDFEDNCSLERIIDSQKLQEVVKNITRLTEDHKKELLQLILKMHSTVMQDPSQEEYGNITCVLQQIEDTLFREKTRDILEKAAPILFPEFYEEEGKPSGEKVVDGNDNAEEEDESDAAAAVTNAAAAVTAVMRRPEKRVLKIPRSLAQLS